MKKDYFYHGTVRKVTIALGQILSGNQILRFDIPNRPSGNPNNELITVPVKYGKGYYYEKVEQPKDGEPRKKIILPHISYHLLNLMPDPERKINNNNKIFNSQVDARTEGQVQWSYAPVPFNFTFQSTIRTKTMGDLLQILEQLLPLFDPSLSVQINPMDKQSRAVNNLTLDLQEENIRVKLEDLDIDDTREDDDGRVECIVSFMVLAQLYKQVKETPIILKIINTFRPSDDLDPDNIDFINGDLAGTEQDIIE